MSTRLLYIAAIGLLLVGANALSAEIDNCLKLATYHEHRIEKEAGVRYCFNKYKATLTQESCNNLVSKKVSALSSLRLSEDLRSLCFYETPTANTLSACLNNTKVFKNANNHDEGVFYCYQQFQDQMTKSDCLKTAKKLIFPAKQDYLEQHCQENDSN